MLGNERRTRNRGINVQQAIGIVVALLLSAIGVGYYSSTHRVKPSATTIADEAIPKLRQSAALLDPELMSDMPTAFNGFLNPCWQSADQLRCLPYVYVSGFHTGAGALARRLAAHPNVVMDAGNLSYWGPSWGYWSEYRNTMRSYLDGIGKAVPELQADPKHNIVMDGSMSTLGLYGAASGKAHRAFSTVAVACWDHCHKKFNGSAGPEYDACMDQNCLPAGRRADEEAAANASLPVSDLQLPLLMRALYGTRSPKFVFMLRNPVDRMYSAYFGIKAMHERHGNSSQGFSKYVQEQVIAWHKCVKSFDEESCIMRFETLSMEQEKVFFHCDQILRGMYDVYLKIWFRFFPRSSFLIIRSEEFFNNATAVMKQVLEFLGLPVPEPSSPTWAAMAAAGPNVTTSAHHGWIPEGSRRVLSKLYTRHNEELSKLLGGDKRWLKWNVETWYE